MDPTSMSEQMRRWSEDFIKKIEALEEENAIQKLRIFELEKNERFSKSSEHQPGKKLRRVVSESDLRKSPQIPMTIAIYPLLIEGARETSGMSGTLSFMSEGADSRPDEIHVKEESANEFIQDNIHIETPTIDENIEMEIDIKEEVVGFEQSDVVNFVQDPVPLIDPLNAEESSGTLFKRDIDESVQILLRSANQMSTTEPLPDEVHTEAEVGTDRELNPSPSKYFTRNVVRQELANPPLQVSSGKLCGQKPPYLTTLIGAKTHTCKNCSARFETKFKLREHNKWHTGEKRLRRRNRTTRFKCSVCEETFSAESILTAHLKTHTGRNLSRSLGKKSSTVEKVDPRERPKKKRRVETQPDVCHEEQIPGVAERMDSQSVEPPPPSVVERSPHMKERIDTPRKRLDWTISEKQLREWWIEKHAPEEYESSKKRKRLDYNMACLIDASTNTDPTEIIEKVICETTESTKISCPSPEKRKRLDPIDKKNEPPKKIRVRRKRIPPVNGKYKCDQCPKEFRVPWYRSRHMQSVHSPDIPCPCGRIYKTKDSLRKHSKKCSKVVGTKNKT